MSDWKTFKAAYAQATTAQKELVDSELLGDYLPIDNLTREERRAVINLLVDVTLKIVEPAAAKSLLTDEYGFDEAVVTSALAEVTQTHHELAEDDDSPAATESESADLASVDDSEPAPLHSVTPLRTMDSDMKKAHGYGALYPDEEEDVHRSSQTDTLAPIADTPQYSRLEKTEES